MRIMEAVALSILVVVGYFILMYIFGATNKNTPKFTPGSFTTTLHTCSDSNKYYGTTLNDEDTAKHYKHMLELNVTWAERTLKTFLTGKINFEFQKIIYTNNKHFFIADFYIPSKNLIIELDGGYHNDIEQQKKDSWRTGVLNSLGYTVIRFDNEQILKSKDLSWVLNIIENK